MQNEMRFKGLSTSKAKELLQKYGPNSVVEQKSSIWNKLTKRLLNPIVLMIEAALAISLFVKDYEDAVIIFILLLVNITVEIWQEKRAENALAELKKSLSNTAMVLRDGSFKEIAVEFLVPGDVVKLSIGEVAPADLELLDSVRLEVDQAAITGESLPQIKHTGDKIFAGSVIKAGSGFAKVIATGASTQMGQSEKLIAESQELNESHFQKAVFKIGKFLILMSILLVVFVATVLFLRGDYWLEILRFSLILIVASIPVALPVVLSVLMAMGSLALARKKAIVKNFVALEELAGVSVLAVDKTGTLTQNKLELQAPEVFNGFSEKELVIFAVLASENENKNAIEQAIEVYARKKGYLKDLERYNEKSFTPFDPKNKTTDVTFDTPEAELMFAVMGAPQVIANKVSEEDRKLLLESTEKVAQKGFRTIALAAGKDKDHIRLVGLLPLFDPPRMDSQATISEIKAMNIDIKMITGDNTAIARYISKILGLSGALVGAKELRDFISSSYDLLYKRILGATVFAGVVPAEKFKIIETLQKNDHIVAMTGDGVNDAPALKKADIGIAVRNATKAAQAAADVVLLSAGLSPIKEAVRQARMIFAKMRSYALFRITETIRIIFFVSFAILLFNFSPLTPTMIILLALLNDIPIMMLTYDNAPLSKEPIRWNFKELIVMSSVMGATGLLASFFLLWFLQTYTDMSEFLIQTIIFLKLDIAGHSTLYTTRTYDKHFWARPYPSLKFFIPAFSSRMIGVTLALLGIFVAKVPLWAMLAIWIYATLSFLFTDFVKVWAFRLFRFLKIF